MRFPEEASDEGAFAAAVSYSDTMDRAWQTKFARGFISKVLASGGIRSRRRC